jgi:hypothetical protein
MFDSLWIDKPAAEEVLERLLADPATAQVGSYLKHFHQFGYCIIPNAVPVDVIDRYLVECHELIEADKLKISLGLQILPAKGADILVPLTKILDVHVFSEAAQKISSRHQNLWASFGSGNLPSA